MNREPIFTHADALNNPSPNAHKYAQLEGIYAHLDSSTTMDSASAGFENATIQAQENWGTRVHESGDGRSAIFERDFGNGFKIFNFVFWAKWKYNVTGIGGGDPPAACSCFSGSF